MPLGLAGEQQIIITYVGIPLKHAVLDTLIRVLRKVAGIGRDRKLNLAAREEG